MKKNSLNVNDVQKLLGKKQGYAYKVIRNLNEELKEKGFYTTAGVIPATYFFERTGINPVGIEIEADEA